MQSRCRRSAAVSRFPLAPSEPLEVGESVETVDSG
jgi:hypothetical protein